MLGYENVEPSQLQELLQSGGILLIDVRTPTESARGGIPGARNIPLHLLPLRTKIGAKLIYGAAAPAHPVPAALARPCAAESWPGCNAASRFPPVFLTEALPPTGGA